MSGQKPFHPTAQKLKKARENGDLAKSQLLTAATSLVAGITLCGITLGVDRRLSRFFEKVLGRTEDFSTEVVLELALEGMYLALETAAPILLGTFVFVLALEGLQSGWYFSAQGLLPKPSRLNPLRKIEKLSFQTFRENLWNCSQTVLLILGGIGVFGLFVVAKKDEIFLVDFDEIEAFINSFFCLLGGLFVVLALLALAVGVADLITSRKRRNERLRMDFEELKREIRESDGDPQIKSWRKQLHQNVLRQGILQGMRKATLLVTGKKLS